MHLLAEVADKTRSEAEQRLARALGRERQRARQETRGGGTALTPPPVLGRQLGATPRQPYMLCGRSPQRVQNTVSPALVTSAMPAV